MVSFAIDIVGKQTIHFHIRATEKLNTTLYKICFSPSYIPSYISPQLRTCGKQGASLAGSG